MPTLKPKLNFSETFKGMISFKMALYFSLS